MSNFIYASLSGFLNILTPIITYPYIARVLGPEKLGLLGVAGALSNYFIVLSLLGLPIYGVRAVARASRNPKALASVTGELISLGTISAAISFGAYVIAILLVPAYRSEFALFLIFGLGVPAAALNVEWFFQGMEKFKFIGLRNVAVKAGFVAALFFFVREGEDYRAYASLFSIALAVNAGINLRAARKLAPFRLFRSPPWRHLRPMALFGLFLFALSAYANLDLLFLGLLSNEREAGYYSVAIRLVRMVAALAATAGTVLLPRLSFVVDRDPKEYLRLLRHSSTYILMFALPAAAGLLSVADDAALVFAGPGFRGVEDSLKILAFVIPVFAASNFLQIQVLVPKGKEKAMTVSFGLGAGAAALALALLTKPYGQIGASIGMVLGEIVVLVAHAKLCGKDQLHRILDGRRILSYAVGAVLVYFVARFPRLFFEAGFLRLALSAVLGGGGFALFLFGLGDPYLKAALRTKKTLGNEEPGPDSARKKTVLHVINSLASGGAEKFLSELLPELQGQGYEVSVFALDARGEVYGKPLLERGIAVEYAESRKFPLFGLLRTMRRTKPDIVHAHLAPSFHWCALATLFSPGTVLLSTEHASGNRRMEKPILLGIERWTYRRYDCIACVSPSVAQALAGWLGPGAARTRIISNGIALDTFSAPVPPAADVAEWLAGRKGIAMVARFVKPKDHGTALRILARMPSDYALVLAGDGPERREIESLAVQLSLEARCRFLGARSDIPAVLAACRAYLQSSTIEGFGIAALEAMAAGLPVAAADAPGLGALVEGCGLLFPPGDERAGAEQILRLEDRLVRETAVERGRERAREFSIRRAAEAYAGVYARGFEERIEP